VISKIHIKKFVCSDRFEAAVDEDTLEVVIKIFAEGLARTRINHFPAWVIPILRASPVPASLIFWKTFPSRFDRQFIDLGLQLVLIRYQRVRTPQ